MELGRGRAGQTIALRLGGLIYVEKKNEKTTRFARRWSCSSSRACTSTSASGPSSRWALRPARRRFSRRWLSLFRVVLAPLSLEYKRCFSLEIASCSPGEESRLLRPGCLLDFLREAPRFPARGPAVPPVRAGAGRLRAGPPYRGRALPRGAPGSLPLPGV